MLHASSGYRLDPIQLFGSLVARVIASTILIDQTFKATEAQQVLKTFKDNCSGVWNFVRNPGQAMAEMTPTRLMWTAAPTVAFGL
jgi:hypothetical protein